MVAVPVAVGAGSTGEQRERLRSLERSVGSERRSALLELYALESELASAREAAGDLASRRARLVRRQTATRQRLAAVRRAAASSTRQLEVLVRRLYEQRGVDPLEVLLGARSLDQALTDLESLDRAAVAHGHIVARSRATRQKLVRLDAELTAQRRVLGRLVQAAAERARELERRAAAKTAYVAELRRRQDLTSRQIAELERAARSAQQQAAELQPLASAEVLPAASEAATAEPAVAAPDGTRTLTVSAIGYSLPGATASGLPVGHGIVAVDPAVIPLGTPMYVPGYGQAVAADTGGAIRGATIDLWFPTRAKALAWGRRTVVITLG